MGSVGAGILGGAAIEVEAGAAVMGMVGAEDPGR